VYHVRLTLAMMLAALSAAAVVGNIGIILRQLFLGRKGVSLVPLVGGLSGALAVLTFPREGLAIWFWIPLALDPGTLILILAPLILLWRHLARHDRNGDQL
jgi:hypothetical protein